ncbi:MAG: DUF116 domain-containing protein [Fusobacteriota bacterium]
MKKIMIYIGKFILTLKVIYVLIRGRFNKNSDYQDSDISKKFVKKNNKRVLKKLKKMKISREDIVILLPHCIQDYNCNIKITSNIDNCKQCGICEIGDILEIQKRFGIDVKVATGGTLARIYLKKRKPKLVIAVACERDLVTGIYDAYPLLVYGIFNLRINGPCYNTKIDFREIEKVLKKIIGG